MNTLALGASLFAPEAFFERAAARLDHDLIVEEKLRLGDEHLNPDVTADGLTFRDAAAAEESSGSILPPGKAICPA